MEGHAGLVLTAMHVVILIYCHEVVVTQSAIGQSLSLVNQSASLCIIGNEVEDLVCVIYDLVVVVPDISREACSLLAQVLEHVLVCKPVGKAAQYHVVALKIHTQVPYHEAGIVGAACTRTAVHEIQRAEHHGLENEVGILLDELLQLLVRY